MSGEGSRYNKRRLGILKETMTSTKFKVLSALPGLLHHRHSSFPGDQSEYSPRGFSGRAFVPFEEGLLPLFPAVRGKLKHPPRRAFKALYTIGSAGSVFFTNSSDVDLWLLIDDGTEASEREEIKGYLRAIEAWAMETAGLDITFFLHRIGSVGRCSFEDDPENAAEFGPLLKEEFLRTGLCLAGDEISWWDGPIDIGEVPRLNPEQYISALFLHLHKAIERPFKSAMKVFLLRALAEGEAVPLPAVVIRDEVRAGNLPDPYITILGIIWDYCRSNGELDAFKRLKETLYLKVIAEEPSSKRVALARKRILDAGFGGIGPPIDMAEIESFPRWSEERRNEFAGRILGFLKGTLSAIVKRTDLAGINAGEVRALTRLFSIRGSSAGGRLPIVSFADMPAAGSPKATILSRGRADSWSLILGHTSPGAEPDPAAVVRNDKSPVSLLAFGIMNKKIVPGKTNLKVAPPAMGPRHMKEISEEISSLLSRRRIPSARDLLAEDLPLEFLIVIEIPDRGASYRLTALRSDTWGTITARAWHGEGSIAEAFSRILAEPRPTPIRIFKDTPAELDEMELSRLVSLAFNDPPERLRLFSAGSDTYLIGRRRVMRFRMLEEILAHLVSMKGPFELAPGAPHLHRTLLERVLEASGKKTSSVHSVHIGGMYFIMFTDSKGALAGDTILADDLPYYLPALHLFLNEAAEQLNEGPESVLFIRCEPKKDINFPWVFSDETSSLLERIPRGKNRITVEMPPSRGYPVTARIGDKTLSAGHDLFWGEMASRIRGMRTHPLFYPAFITGVRLPEAIRERATLTDYFRTKIEIERRINTELRKLYR